MYETSSSLLVIDNSSQPEVLINPESSNCNEFDNSNVFNFLYFSFLLLEDFILLLLVRFGNLIDMQYISVQNDKLCIRILQILYFQKILRDLDFSISINIVSHCWIVLDKFLHLSRTISIQDDPHTKLIDDIYIMLNLRSVSWISLRNWPSVTLKDSTWLVSVLWRLTR